MEKIRDDKIVFFEQVSKRIQLLQRMEDIVDKLDQELQVHLSGMGIGGDFSDTRYCVDMPRSCLQQLVGIKNVGKQLNDDPGHEYPVTISVENDQVVVDWENASSTRTKKIPRMNVHKSWQRIIEIIQIISD